VDDTTSEYDGEGQDVPPSMLLNPEVPWDDIDPPIRDLVRLLNELPGLKTVSSCGGHDEPGADEQGRGPNHWDVFLRPRFDFPGDADEVWPDRDGWLTLEFLCWVTRDLRRAGKKIWVDVDAPAPQLNGPGRCLTFIIEGDRAGDGGYGPEEFISDLNSIFLKIYAPVDTDE
jgi:hypothetical protein